MIRKKSKLRVFKAASGGIYDPYKPLPTDVSELGGDPTYGAMGDSLSNVPKINVQQDNTNYTRDYAMKGATMGASLMAVNPVVGIIATGVGATAGAIAGGLKESKAKAQNRDLMRGAGTQQIAQNKAWNNDSLNLAKKRDMRKSRLNKLNSIQQGDTSFYGDLNLVAKKGAKVTKANDGLFSNKSLGIREVDPMNIEPTEEVVPKAGLLNAQNAGAFANMGLQLADAIMDYSKPTKGYMYRAKKGMKALKGGSVEPLSADTSLIKGRSHAEGGVDVTEVVNPNSTAKLEAEGDETMKDTPEATMIFSDSLKVPGSKETFADVHKSIASRKGKLEKKMMKYSEEPRHDNKTAIKAMTFKHNNLNSQEDLLFELQQNMNGNHSNEGVAKNGMKVLKSKQGSKLDKYANTGTSILSGALQYYNLENRVRQNQKARQEAVNQIAGLSIPTQKRLDNITIDYARNDVARADVNNQLQNFRNTVGANTSGNQVGVALTGLLGRGLEQNAALVQEQENARIAAKNATTTANLEIDRSNNQNSLNSAMLRLERDKDVINDRANLVTDYNSEHSEYVTDNFRKEAYADKNLAYQYAGLSPENQAYLKSQGLSPEHWTGNANRVLGSFGKGGKAVKNNCGGKLLKARFGANLHKDCGCK